MKSQYAQVLVHLNAGSRNVRRVRYAQELAAPQGANVTALYAIAPAILMSAYAPESGAAIAEALAEFDSQRRDRAHADFEQANAGARVRAEWAEDTEWPTTTEFAMRALHSDLLVLEQRDAEESGTPVDFIEAVLQASGKPAIVLPASDLPYASPARIAIAWKPTREAACAVSGAMPLLQRAQHVDILTWGEEAASPDEAALERFLELHDVRVTWRRQADADRADVGDLLLSRTYDLGADLLVMGCYGHYRATEWALGGVSRTVLRSMTLPVLMAH